MIHENWIPIGQFDKEKHQGERMLFAEFGGLIPWFEAGEWDMDWDKFWNGESTFRGPPTTSTLLSIERTLNDLSRRFQTHHGTSPLDGMP